MDFTNEEVKLYSDIVCGILDNIIKELEIKYDKSIFRKKYYKEKIDKLYKIQYEKYKVLENMMK